MSIVGAATDFFTAVVGVGAAISIVVVLVLDRTPFLLISIISNRHTSIISPQ